MSGSLENWLRSSLGKSLKDVFALTFVFESDKDLVHPQALDFRFESLHKGVLSTAGDGESIDWCDGGVLESIDFGEYGAVCVEEVSHLEVWATVLEKELQQFEIITTSQGEQTVGIALKFESDAWVSVLNLGDELWVFSEIPQDIFDAEGFVFEKNLAGRLRY